MTKIFAIMFSVGISMAAVSSAEAAGGCGEGWHRGPHGGCLRNYAHPDMHACARGWHLNHWGRCVRSW